jgi:flagellar motor switch protein FliG
VEKVMRRALGDDKANSVLNRIMPGQGTKGLDILSWMDARGIADMIRTEHPQVIAIILSLLDGVVAAEVLIFLPAEIRPEVIQRVATLDTVQPAAMAELESIMKQQFSKSASQQSSSFGGVTAAAKIMNLTKTELESSIMQGLGDIDPDLMMKIQDQMFTFDNLASVDNKGVQVLMRAVEPDLLMTALKGASEEVANRFYDNMSERARGMFKDDMEAKGPVRLSDVEEAQKKIMRQARKLSDSGELMLGGADFV